MAVPTTMTTVNISGKYTQNKSLSDNTDEILRLQGVGLLVRKALGMATLYVTINHLNEDETSVENKLFGPTISKTRRAKPEDLEEIYLKEGWSEATKEHGIIHILNKSDTEKSKNTWIIEGAWGIEEVGGEPRYVRHVYFTGPKGEEIRARMVFDYLGPA
ncbi:hypothetical protein EW026_g3796 [Hermanssonia centrifuga]|uniref:Uncharacterized protein n=1 Tax=Hermanssonia centrifuga TaxID=98765 RepID=A0A4S4KNP6_9APHY|nr:hypothetical protein EW026_g3796 [Hermanssonia centrifuga]